MADIVDMATAEITAFNRTALVECCRKRQRALKSHRKCANCGAVIPPEPGVKLCIDCQEEVERANH